MESIFNDLKKHLMNLDWFLIIAVVLTTGYGMLLIKSASNPMDTNKYVIVQALAMFIGIAAMFIESKIDYCQVLKYSKYLYVLAVAAMVGIIIFGTGEEETGRGSWIRFGGIGIQPSEIVKIIYIVCFAKHLNSVKDNPSHPKNIAMTLLYAGIVIGLVVVDNMGSALVFMFITVSMCFIAGVSIWYFIGVIAAAIPLSPIIFNLLEDYQKKRILIAFSPELDPDNSGYQVLRSIRAIGSGGLTGAGFQNGYITQNGYLPKQQTDFIFATAGEEFGFLGAVLVMVMLAVIIIRIFYISRHARNDVGSLMCIGVLAMLIAQVIVNIGMCIGMMPVIGVTLPFFSYGGSSILSCYMGIGVVLSVYARRNIYFFQRGDDFDFNEDDELLD